MYKLFPHILAQALQHAPFLKMKWGVFLLLFAQTTPAESAGQESPTGAWQGHGGRLGHTLQVIATPAKHTAMLRQGVELVGPVPTYSPLDPRGKVGRVVILSLLAVILALILLWAWLAKGRRASEEEADQERENKNIPQDAYGFGVACLIRDFYVLTTGDGSLQLRCSRVTASILLIALNIAIQVLLIFQIQKFITSKWVHDIRNDYDKYELHMYGDEPGHTTLTVNGKHRGVPGYLEPDNFDSLPNGLKERVCSIPFSEPVFFLSILLIWTLTCMIEIRQCLDLFSSLIVRTPTITSMANSLEYVGEETTVLLGGKPLENEQLLVGLTTALKILIVVIVIIPRLVITLVLLWLGSRFLAATNDFSELVLNAVGLEFVLFVKDLLYVTVVPERNKREVDYILLRPSARMEPASYLTYLGSFKWLYISFMWGIYYMYWMQQVLPQYRWDVRALCGPWLLEHYGHA